MSPNPDEFLRRLKEAEKNAGNNFVAREKDAANKLYKPPIRDMEYKPGRDYNINQQSMININKVTENDMMLDRAYRNLTPLPPTLPTTLPTTLPPILPPTLAPTSFFDSKLLYIIFIFLIVILLIYLWFFVINKGKETENY